MEVSKVSGIVIKGDKRPKGPSGPEKPLIRTRDLETLLHLDKVEMKYLEAISQLVKLDLDIRARRNEELRDQRNRILIELRRKLSDRRVDRILDRIAELNGDGD
jgi:hypothetical protein